MSGRPHTASVCIWWRVGFWGLSAGPRPIGIPKRLKAQGALYIRDNRPFGLFRTFTSAKGYRFFSFGNKNRWEREINAVWSRTADTFEHLTSITFSTFDENNLMTFILTITGTVIVYFDDRTFPQYQQIQLWFLIIKCIYFNKYHSNSKCVLFLISSTRHWQWIELDSSIFLGCVFPSNN